MTLNELERIHDQVDASTIAITDKTKFMALIENYQRDFLALVELARDLLDAKPTGEREIAINTIRHSAKSIQNILEMASFQEVF